MKWYNPFKRIKVKNKKAKFSLGKKNDDGTVTLIENGKETNVRIQVWTKEQVDAFNKL